MPDIQSEKVKKFVKILKSLNFEVNFNTKARGHQGFFLKNRIDISKNIKKERIIPTLLHEFTHFVHSKIEPNMPKNGGSLEVLFDLRRQNQNDFVALNLIETFREELIKVTNFVDENSLGLKLQKHKEIVKGQIFELSEGIKLEYPTFQRSKKFKEFNKYIRWSKAKSLLKYDKVCYVGLFSKKVYSVENVEQDFPEMPKAFAKYIKLNSLLKKQKRISARMGKINRYYTKPTELFARFVEGLYIDKQKVLQLAPKTYERFFELEEKDFYPELRNIFSLLEI